MWEINNSNQVASFFIFFLCGVFLKLVYDIFRAKRMIRKNKPFFDVVVAFVFWFFSTFVTFLLLLVRTNGAVRGYAIFAELTGFVICHLTLSRIYMKLLRMLFTAFYFIYDKISALIGVFLCLIAYVTTEISKISVKCLKKGALLLKKLLKNGIGMLYTKDNRKIVEGEEFPDEG